MTPRKLATTPSWNLTAGGWSANRKLTVGPDDVRFARHPRAIVRTAVAANGETATLQRLYFLRGNLSDLKNRIEEDVEKGIWRQEEHYE